MRFTADERRPEVLPGSEESVRVRCAGCGLEAYQPQPAMNQLREFFDEPYYESGYAALQQQRRRLIDEALCRLQPYFPGQSRILDFGAGTGFWAARLRDMGHQVDALETSDAARRRLAANGFSTVSSLEEAPGPYDAVLLMDVLGSCENPVSLVAALSRRLCPGGHLIVRTPHYQGTWRRCLEAIAYRKGETPPWYPTILWRFQPRELGTCLRRAGLELVDTWYEIQPWTLRSGGWKPRTLRRACVAWDRLTGNGDEFYTIGRMPG
jgi:SAM-dependent methyltransferase